MQLTFKNKFGFALGAVGKDIVYMLISSYLLYYYNAVLGISSAFIGSVLMLARIFDALNDPIMGIIVAKTKTKFGRFRPWILAGTVLNAVTIYALFATPEGMQKSGVQIWLAVFYLLWGITYTMMDIPFWSLIPAVTEPGQQRESLSSLTRSFSGIGDAIPTILTMIVVPILSGSTVIADYRIGFKWWALIIAVFFVISELVCVLNVPEKDITEMETPGIKQMFTSLFKNDQALTVVAAVILVYTALNIVGNLILYFFQFDVGDTDAYSAFVAVCFAVQVVAMACVPMIRKKVEKLSLFFIGIVVQIIGFGVLLFMALTGIYHSSGWILLALPGSLVYAGYGILNVLLTVFLSDSVDYGEVKNGSRDESVIFSMQTFTVKLAAGMAVFIAGLAIDLVGIDPEALSQTGSALMGLRMFMTIPSVLLLVLSALVFKKFYKLDDETMADIQTLLRKDA